MSERTKVVAGVVLIVVAVAAAIALLLMSRQPVPSQGAADEDVSPAEVVETASPQESEAVEPVGDDSESPFAGLTVGVPSVAGRVVDGDGEPIAGAKITVRLRLTKDLKDAYRKMRLPVTRDEPVLTGQDGTFDIRLSYGAADFDIAATAEGYASDATRLYVPEKGRKEGIEFVLEPLGFISGRVVDAKGRPLVGLDIQGNQFWPLTGASKSLGANGEFVIEDARAGVYRLGVKSIPWGRDAGAAWLDMKYFKSPEAYQLSVGPRGVSGDDSVRVQLEWGERVTGVEVVADLDLDTRIAGRVVDEDGEPVEGAAVHATRKGLTREVGRGLGPTDSEGRFLVPYVFGEAPSEPAPETVTLAAECEGYEVGWVDGVAVGTMDAEIVLPPARVGTLRGAVLDEATGKPIPDCRILVTQQEESPELKARPWARHSPNRQGDEVKATTDSEGTFLLEGLRAGVASLRVRGPYTMDLLAMSPQVLVEAGEITDLEILVPPLGKLEINVAYTGHLEGGEYRCSIDFRTQGPDGEVELSGSNLCVRIRPGQLAETGALAALSYRVGLPPGKYDVVAGVADLPMPTSRRYDHAGVWQTVPAEVIRGRVTSVDITLGGRGAVEAHVPRREGERWRRVTLTPVGEEAVGAPDLGSGESRLGTAWGYSMAYHASVSGDGVAYVNCVPEGAYVLSVFALTGEEKRFWRLCDAQEVQVRTDELTVVEFQ